MAPLWAVWSLLSSLWWATAGEGLYFVFRRGPAVWPPHGMWAGRGDADVCAATTGVAAAFWAEHPAACAEEIHRRFVVFAIVAHWALCCAAAWAGWRALQSYLFGRFVVRELRAQLFAPHGNHPQQQRIDGVAKGTD